MAHNSYIRSLHFPTADNFTTAPLIGETRALELVKLRGPQPALLFSPPGKHPDDSLVCELGGLGYFDVGLSVGVWAGKNCCMSDLFMGVSGEEGERWWKVDVAWVVGGGWESVAIRWVFLGCWVPTNFWRWSLIHVCIRFNYVICHLLSSSI